MRYNEKKSLYESIMRDVAKTVKRMINEAGIVQFSPIQKTEWTQKDVDRVSKKLQAIRTATPEIYNLIVEIVNHHNDSIFKKIWHKTVDNGGYDEELKNLTK